jgi:hypothetical protein
MVGALLFQRPVWLTSAAAGQQPRPILDSEDRVVAVLAGRPKNPRFLEAADLACRAIFEEGKSVSFKHSERNHVRGLFPAINVGVARPPGSPEPANLSAHPQMVARLLANSNVQILASYASCGSCQLPI